MILLIITLWLFFGELRSKAIAVEIGGGFVTYSGFLGLAKSKTRRFKYFDGYKTSILPAKGKNYEYLYLIRNNRKILKISELYHSNYHELKLKIAESMVNIGFEEPSYLTEIKEIFR